jgi:hypothetical protein
LEPPDGLAIWIDGGDVSGLSIDAQIAIEREMFE